MSSSGLPTAEQILEMSPAEVGARAMQLDIERRRAEAAVATFAGEVDGSAAFVADGHRSVRSWGQASCNWSSAEAARVARLGRAFELMPSFGVSARAGEIGVAQMHALAAVVVNPRVREHLADSEALLVRYARELDHDAFITVLRRWEQLADADGAEHDRDRAHQDRRASLILSGDRMFLDAVGAVAHGVQLQEILDRFTTLEWQQEWADGVDRFGERMNPSLMQRTSAQRRFDALVSVFRAAAGSDAVGGDVVVNIVVDQATFEHQVALAAGGHPEPLDPASVADRRCETDRGGVLHPGEAFAAALVGHVRRVVFGADGVVLDFGRRKRLFTGALREAVLLSAPRCLWPGCDRPSSQCEADHTVPFTARGPTAAHNGAPLCDRHNVWKSRGFATVRGPIGRWSVFRIDGTGIGWQHEIEARVLAA